MTSVSVADIKAVPAQVILVEVRAGSRIELSETVLDNGSIIFKQYHPDFVHITGKNPTYSLLVTSVDSSRNPFFEDGCTYLPDQDELYVTSGLLQTTNSSRLPIILISKISLHRSQPGDQSIGPSSQVTGVEWMKLRAPPAMPLPVGAIPYLQGVLYCSQGTLVPESGGLYYMPHGKPPVPVLTGYYNKPFNSIHSVVKDKSGALWFTDPAIGFEQGIRPRPQLPAQIYYFNPENGDLRVVADGFTRPSGIALNQDESTLYVTDTAASLPDGSTDPRAPASIYALDVITRSNTPFLANKRVFAYALSGVPKMVTCDLNGNVYAACSDGVEVWGPGGRALGLIELSGGCTSMCFGRCGELFICAKERLWRIQLEEATSENRKNPLGSDYVIASSSS
ncbi:D-lactonohydrolase-like protein-like protein [Xylariaceae sp. FL0016]|nr:D-lactonohydrolase-like protein-like protein [Xylariaceae sp. FL0016]